MATNTIEFTVNLKPHFDTAIRCMEELRDVAAKATENFDALIASLKEMNDESGSSDTS